MASETSETLKEIGTELDAIALEIERMAKELEALIARMTANGKHTNR